MDEPRTALKRAGAINPHGRRPRSRFTELAGRVWAEGAGAVAEEVIKQLAGSAPPQLARLAASANLVAVAAGAALGEHWLQSPVGVVAGAVVATVVGGLVKSGAEWVVRGGKPTGLEAVEGRLARQQREIDQLRKQQEVIVERARGPDLGRLRSVIEELRVFGDALEAFACTIASALTGLECEHNSLVVICEDPLSERCWGPWQSLAGDMDRYLQRDAPAIREVLDREIALLARAPRAWR